MSKKSSSINANANVLRLQESFSLRKIDSKLIVQKFLQNGYSNRTLPDTKIKNNVALFGNKEIGKDKNSEVFTYKDKNNNAQTIYTTNHALYKYVTDQIKDKDNKDLNCPILKCKYCKRGNMKKPIGLPIAMTIEGDNAIFDVVDSFCDFGCAFSYLKRRTGGQRVFRGILYSNAEQLLHCLYYRVYPERTGSNIKDKPDWDLLRENGGPLTNEEFDCDSAEYIPVPSAILFPSKKQYMKLNIN